MASAQALHRALPEADLWFWDVADTVHEVQSEDPARSHAAVRGRVRARQSRHRVRAGARQGQGGRPRAGARPAWRPGGERRIAGDVRNARDSLHRVRLGVVEISPSTRPRPSALPRLPASGAGGHRAGRYRRGVRRIRQADRKTGAGRIELRPDLRQCEAGPRRRPQRREDRGISDRAVRRRHRGDLRRAGAVRRHGDVAAAGRDRPGGGRVRLHRQISAQIDPGDLPGPVFARDHRRTHGPGAAGAPGAVLQRLFPHRFHRLGEGAGLSGDQHLAGPDGGLALSQGAEGAGDRIRRFPARPDRAGRKAQPRADLTGSRGGLGREPARP